MIVTSSLGGRAGENKVRHSASFIYYSTVSLPPRTSAPLQPTRKMSLKYSEKWNTAQNGLDLGIIFAATFSVDGTLLACCNNDCTFVLSAESGSLITRIWFSRRPCSLIWIPGQPSTLTCVYDNGTLVNVFLADSVSVRSSILFTQG